MKAKLTEHEKACMRLRPGMRVIVDHYVPDQDGGWYNGWTDDMKRHIDKTVFTVHSWDAIGVRFEEHPSGWPAHALKKYEPEILSRQTAKVKLL
jgi:hypothetical protein